MYPGILLNTTVLVRNHRFFYSDISLMIWWVDELPPPTPDASNGQDFITKTNPKNEQGPLFGTPPGIFKAKQLLVANRSEKLETPMIRVLRINTHYINTWIRHRGHQGLYFDVWCLMFDVQFVHYYYYCGLVLPKIMPIQSQVRRLWGRKRHSHNILYVLCRLLLSIQQQ